MDFFSVTCHSQSIMLVLGLMKVLSNVWTVQAASEWLYIVPWGLEKTLTWISKCYNQPQMYITENGEL